MKKLVGAAVMAATLIGSGHVQADYIYNNGPMGAVWSVGTDSGLNFFGQTFSLPATDPVLDSFSITLARSASGTPSFSVMGYIGAWDGVKVTDILFSAEDSFPENPIGNIFTPKPTVVKEFTFDTGNLLLNPSQEYVMFLGASAPYLNVLLGTNSSGSYHNSYSGGYAVATASTGSFNYGGSFGNCEYGVLTCWSVNSNIYGHGGTAGDFLMTINSSPAPIQSTVPEPEAYAMLLAGLGLLSFTARRRKQSA